MLPVETSIWSRQTTFLLSTISNLSLIVGLERVRVISGFSFASLLKQGSASSSVSNFEPILQESSWVDSSLIANSSN